MSWNILNTNYKCQALFANNQYHIWLFQRKMILYFPYLRTTSTLINIIRRIRNRILYGKINCLRYADFKSGKLQKCLQKDTPLMRWKGKESWQLNLCRNAYVSQCVCNLNLSSVFQLIFHQEIACTSPFFDDNFELYVIDFLVLFGLCIHFCFHYGWVCTKLFRYLCISVRLFALNTESFITLHRLNFWY